MGNISKLIKEMKKFKKYTDEELNKQIASLDKIRNIIKYNPQTKLTSNKEESLKGTLSVKDKTADINFCKYCGAKLR